MIIIHSLAVSCANKEKVCSYRQFPSQEDVLGITLSLQILDHSLAIDLS